MNIDNAITNGFQFATAAGPLCGEPLRSTAFFVDDVKFNNVDNNNNNNNNEDNSTYFKGLLTSSLTNAFKLAFEKGSSRLVEPFYHCNVLLSGYFFSLLFFLSFFFFYYFYFVFLNLKCK